MIECWAIRSNEDGEIMSHTSWQSEKQAWNHFLMLSLGATFSINEKQMAEIRGVFEAVRVVVTVATDGSVEGEAPCQI